MKIAIFTDTYLPEINGVSVCVNLLARELSKYHKVILFCPKYLKGNKKGTGDFKLIRIKSVPLPVYNTLRFSLPNIVRIYKILKKFKPDIIHFHCPGPLGIASVVLSKTLNIPVVTTYHTLYNELLFYISPADKLKKIIKEKTLSSSIYSSKNTKKLSLIWKRMLNTKRRKGSRMEKITWKAIVEFHSICNKIIVPSPTVKRSFDKKGLKNKTVNIFNGVDINQNFLPKNDYKLRNNILFVGRIAKEKNIDVLLKAFEITKTKLPNLKLTIVGDGPVLSDLKKLAMKLNIENDVKFLGLIPQKELSGIYRDADIFCITSTAENQALVVLEAMASGLPILGVNKHGLSDLIENDKNGHLIKPGDAKFLSKFIIELIEDQNKRERFGRYSRKMAEKHDIWEIAKQTIDLYESLTV